MMPNRDRKKLPGRPFGKTGLREKILDAAEELFSEQGYAGTSMRHVAQASDVTTALISYYFTTKENLFREVFMRKGCEVADARMAALKTLYASDNELSVEDLIRAFLLPSSMLRKTRQGRSFLRLHARLHMEPEKFSLDLRREVYDESTAEFSKAFRQVLPTLSAMAITMRLTYLIGAYLYAFSGASRLEELVQDVCKEDHDRHFEEMVVFFTAGMEQGK